MTPDEIKNYIQKLRGTDWLFMYAEGPAYHKGVRSVLEATELKKELLRKFPADSKWIEATWEALKG